MNMPPPPRLPRLTAIHILIAMLIAGTAFQVVGAWTNSQTTDETNHLSSGVAYLRTNDFRINPEHPPLTKLLAAWPLLFRSDIKVDTTTKGWEQKDIRAVGRSILYPPQNSLADAQRIFFVSRLPMILWWLAMAILIFWAARRRWGDWPALLASGLFIFDPNFLGHGHLINTDVPLTAAFFGAILALDAYLRSPSRRRLLMVSIAVGITLLVKFSAVIILPLVAALGAYRVWYDRATFSWKRWMMILVSIGVVSGAMIWACYGLELRQTSSVKLTQSRVVTMVKRLRLPVPALSYLNGLLRVKAHNNIGHKAFLLGQSSTTGWWYYFPVAIAVKTPLITLGALLIALGFGIRRIVRRQMNRQRLREIFSPANLCLALPPLVFFLIAVFSQLNLGLRHIFPVYPFLFLAIGWAVAQFRRSWQPMIAGAMLIGSVAVTVLAWPNTISYFNAAAGGTGNGRHILLGANLDWGQDVYRLRSFIDENGFTDVHIALADSVPSWVAAPEAKRMLNDKLVAAGGVPSGVVFVSVSILDSPTGHVVWLLKYTPRWTIGSTIYGYDFRK